MVQVRDLTETTVEELREEEDWWGEVKEQTLSGVKRLLEGAMEGELMEQHAAWMVRCAVTRADRCPTTTSTCSWMA